MPFVRAHGQIAICIATDMQESDAAASENPALAAQYAISLAAYCAAVGN